MSDTRHATYIQRKRALEIRERNRERKSGYNKSSGLELDYSFVVLKE